MWITAIEKELSSLEEKGTWSQEDKIPSNESILPSFLVLQIKRKSDGSVERFKARLVANGHRQKSKDYSATSSPVLDFSVVMFFTNYILKTGMKHRHIDFETAFLNGELQEELYIGLPSSLPKKFHRQVRRLKKAIYGLKQAHRRWHDKLTANIIEEGFTELKYARCVFVKIVQDSTIFILLYVDDMIIAAKTENQIILVIEMLQKLYKVRD